MTINAFSTDNDHSLNPLQTIRKEEERSKEIHPEKNQLGLWIDFGKY